MMFHKLQCFQLSLQRNKKTYGSYVYNRRKQNKRPNQNLLFSSYPVELTNDRNTGSSLFLPPYYLTIINPNTPCIPKLQIDNNYILLLEITSLKLQVKFSKHKVGWLLHFYCLVAYCWQYHNLEKNVSDGIWI